MSARVFLLMHTHEFAPDNEDFKLIGVYSSKAAANSAMRRTRILPGFSSAPKGFHIEAYPVDKDHWTEGFITEVLPRHLARTKSTKRKRRARNKRRSQRRSQRT